MTLAMLSGFGAIAAAADEAKDPTLRGAIDVAANDPILLEPHPRLRPSVREDAVSEMNLKIRGAVGAADDASAWSASAMLTTPLAQSWGLQLEGAGSGVDDSTVYGAAAHVFARDPDAYLLGLFAGYAAETDFDIDALRVGAEAEIYLNQISVLVAGGYQFSDDVDEMAFGEIELRWYVTNDFVLSAGGSFDEERSVGRAGVEWQPGFAALPGLAFRVDGAFGEDDYESIMGGITYYFGTDASLIDRHRKQDPDSALVGLLSAVQREQAKLCAQYGC